MADRSVTVILPAFNEEMNIAETVKGLRQRYPDFEILVIDDGSTDMTVKLAGEAGGRVCSHPYNIGNGAAIKTGLRRASGEIVVMMDADGQHDPADMANLLKYMEQYDMVVGARTRSSEASWHRNLANRIFNGLATYITRFRVEDLTSGFRAVKRETAAKFIYLLPNTFSYPSTLTLAYLRSGRSIKYVPVTTKGRKGKSKIKLLRDGVRFLLIISKIATLYAPFRVFLPISFLFFSSGIGYYVYSFFTAHRFTNMSALLLTTSVIIFMMGLVSEQISLMRYDRVED